MSQVQWFWTENNGYLYNYDEKISDLIEKYDLEKNQGKFLEVEIKGKKYLIDKYRREQLVSTNPASYPRQITRGTWFKYISVNGLPLLIPYSEKLSSILESSYQNALKSNSYDQKIIDFGDGENFIVLHSKDLILEYKYSQFGAKIQTFPLRIIDLKSSDLQKEFSKKITFGSRVVRGYQNSYPKSSLDGVKAWYFHVQSVVEPNVKNFQPHLWKPLNLTNTLYLNYSKDVLNSTQVKLFDQENIKNIVVDLGKDQLTCDFISHHKRKDAKQFKNVTFPITRSNWFWIGDNGERIPYNEAISDNLENALKNRSFNKGIPVDKDNTRSVILENENLFYQARNDNPYSKRMVLRGFQGLNEYFEILK